MKEEKKETSFEVIRRVFLGASSIFIGLLYIVLIIPLFLIILDLSLHLVYNVVIDVVLKSQTTTFESIINWIQQSTFSVTHSFFVFIIDIFKTFIPATLILFALYIIGDMNIRITDMFKLNTRFTQTYKRYKVIFQFLIFVIIFMLYKTFGPMILDMIL